MSDPRTPEQLTKDAWVAMDELTSTGVITLPNGTKVAPDAKVIVDTFKWLAQFSGKPKKTPKAMDGWSPRETKA